MTRLRRIVTTPGRGRAFYCVPRAIAFLLGISPFDAERLLRKQGTLSRGKDISGVLFGWYEAALADVVACSRPRLRFVSRERAAGTFGKGYTFARLGTFEPLRRGRWIVTIGRHAIAIDSGRVFDYAERGIAIDASRHAKAVVYDAIEIHTPRRSAAAAVRRALSARDSAASRVPSGAPEKAGAPRLSGISEKGLAFRNAGEYILP